MCPASRARQAAANSADALHVCVLCRLARLDQPQRHAVAVGPSIERVSGDRALVAPVHLRQAAELADPIEHPRHVLAEDAMIDRYVDCCLLVLIGDCQALESPPVLETVADEIDGPHLVRRPCELERAALYRHASPALAPGDLQPLFGVDALHALAVHRQPLAADQRMDALIAEPPSLRREQHDTA